MTSRQAIAHIERHGALLVFPIKNRKEPLSLWSAFFPRSEMRWEWDETGDNRVAEMWHLREELSRSGKVVYAKWYQGRATFFSRALFPSLLSILNPELSRDRLPELSEQATALLKPLGDSSPLSTKELKRACGLEGRIHEPQYQRGLKELWSRLLVVGYGEVDDGAFPSLAVGATELMFEDLWRRAKAPKLDSAEKEIEEALQRDSVFYKYLAKLMRGRPDTATKTTTTAPKKFYYWNPRD